MKTTSVSDFRANLKKYLDIVICDYDSVIINRGSTGAVLISLEEYNSIKSTEAIINSASTVSSIERGLTELSDGDYEEIDINEL